MKVGCIIPTLAVVALASNAHINLYHQNELFRRTIDPKTMDPTQLSVLSVLRTAIPTGPNIALPTGDFEPEWYAKLPADIKSLLPSLYPAKVVVAAATATATSDGPTPVPESVIQTPVAPVASSLAILSTSLPLSSALVSSAPANASAYVPTTTTGINATTAASATRSTNGTLPSVTPPASPTPSGSFSTGTKAVIKTELLAGVIWVSVGAAFFLFA
ncbi:hypothetical protein BKA66DRAFT_160644 [Pyrenochaeta sp. MPI-SDFR-AT-0127]|nr:hypothetical protein BKA66DRAFT_160644 [Pyrenochaeta sp. MPI-SDFR-AT-0127]